MKNILLTGASSGIGRAILDYLLENSENRVFTLARNLEKIDRFDENLEKIHCDLTNLGDLEKVLHSLKKIDFDIIINVAGLGYFGPHEEINISKIKNMLAVNLQAPLIICQYFLRGLKKTRGTIINISSITATISSPYGAAYSATKAGLSHFSSSLFDEVRKYGVKVVCIQPDMTATDFYARQNFDCDRAETLSFLKVEDVQRAVKFVLESDENVVLTELNLRPQLHRIKRK